MPKAIDLTGKRFGRLLVIKRVGTNKRHEATWLCKCDCGNTKTISRSRLREGTRSCGCLIAETVRKDDQIQGHRFGRLVAVKPTDQRKGGSVMWVCKCDCGNETITSSTQLLRGTTMSCGCLNHEKVSKFLLNKKSKMCGTDLDFLKQRSQKHSSKFKGVSFRKSTGRWRAGIGFKGNKIDLGEFKNECEAASAYITEAKRLFDPILIANGREPLNVNRYFEEGY